MRLIDADSLKEVIFSKSDSMEDLWDTAGVLNLINNAPTEYLKDIHQEGHYDGHIEGHTKAINEERPQGEWIIDEDTIFGTYSNYRKCSICNEDAEWLYGGSQFLSKFCPNCGVRMKGETNETD